ncbi:NmrA-like family domain-containing protein 1 [Ceratobasidium sp. AG-Ba]|nr:NmrA-like family domain-containing protein 1 [Ceratobasidium sp. AG-Ba]
MGLSTEGKPIIADFKADCGEAYTARRQCYANGIRNYNPISLSEAGAAVVYADFDSLDSLCLAFKDYFEAFEKELQQGINYRRCKNYKSGTSCILVRQYLNDRGSRVSKPSDSAAPHTPGLDVKAFKHKAAAGDYLRSSDIPYTIFATSFYYGNIFLFDAITRNRAGGWRLSFPFPTDIPIPSVSPKDIGQYVRRSDALNDIILIVIISQVL